MTKNEVSIDDETKQYSSIEYSLYCDSLDEQYSQAKENGVFEIIKLLDLDEKNSDAALVKAVKHFKEKDGFIDEYAPTDFLIDREIDIVKNGGEFRKNLYCMFLSVKFAEALQNKSGFLQNSFEFSFCEA